MPFPSIFPKFLFIVQTAKESSFSEKNFSRFIGVNFLGIDKRKMNFTKKFGFQSVAVGLDQLQSTFD